MIRFLLSATIVCLALVSSPAVGAIEENYGRGVAAFERKEYAEARDAFTAVIESDQRISADLLFGLGNTFFRLNDPGTAALWYRRALLLAPMDLGVRQNLRLIGRLTGFVEFGSEVRGAFPVVTRVAIVASWLAAICLAALLALRPRWPARLWLWLGFAVSLASAGATLAILWVRVPPAELARRAVVTKNDVAALSAPTPTAGVIIDLPAGSEVSVKEAREGWSYVEIPGERARVGWVRRDALASLWPYSMELIK